MTNPLILYNHPVSSYAQKIRIALREKNIPFTPILPEAIKTGKPDPTFQSANPRLEVPTLIDGDVQIFDSTIILEYLEDKYPEPALLPSPRTDAAGRATARMIEEVCDTTYEAINWGWGEVLWMERATGPLKEKLRAEAEQQTRAIQAWLTAKLGRHDYFGDAFSSGSSSGSGTFGFGWADICAAPIVNRSAYFGWGPEEGSPLFHWLERVRRRDSVRATFDEFHAAVGNMAVLAPLFQTGERKREYRDHRLEWMVKSGGIEVVQSGLEKRNIRFVWPDAQT